MLGLQAKLYTFFSSSTQLSTPFSPIPPYSTPPFSTPCHPISLCCECLMLLFSPLLYCIVKLVKVLKLLLQWKKQDTFDNSSMQYCIYNPLILSSVHKERSPYYTGFCERIADRTGRGTKDDIWCSVYH